MNTLEIDIDYSQVNTCSDVTPNETLYCFFLRQELQSSHFGFQITTEDFHRPDVAHPQNGFRLQTRNKHNDNNAMKVHIFTGLLKVYSGK